MKRDNQQLRALRKGIRLLASTVTRVPAPKSAISGQPFDHQLLRLSPLYRRSRRLFLEFGGSFQPALLSSARSLGSPTLLDPKIEYSPVEAELLWSATDSRERRNSEHLLTVRTYVTSIFHEQNHRTLWKFLPPAPTDRVGIRRYLNFAESLVIALDMALGDELGPRSARLFYLTGSIYDPGTDVRCLGLNKRAYRNYLQAALHATYLNLEFFDPAQIPRGIAALFSSLGPLAGRAARRSGNLDRAFIWRTGPAWRRRHLRKAIKRLSRPGEEGLRLSADPMDNRLQYLFAERWFELFGL